MCHMKDREGDDVQESPKALSKCHVWGRIPLLTKSRASNANCGKPVHPRELADTYSFTQIRSHSESISASNQLKNVFTSFGGSRCHGRQLQPSLRNPSPGGRGKTKCQRTLPYSGVGTPTIRLLLWKEICDAIQTGGTVSNFSN